MKKPPSLRNNNGSLQVRVRIDGRDAFINRLGRWSDPVAVARAQAISAQIWSDYQQGTFDRSLIAYQPLVEGKQVCLLEALRVRAEQKRQAAAIHAYRLLEGYGQPIRTQSMKQRSCIGPCCCSEMNAASMSLHSAVKR